MVTGNIELRINNYAHHGEKKPQQEVEDGYILRIILRKKSEYLTNFVLGAVLIGRTVTVKPTAKPTILGY